MPAPRVHVLNGPNLNLLGVREPDIYGRQTLRDVEQLCQEVADRHGLELIFRTPAWPSTPPPSAITPCRFSTP
jgi:3-dehydroquinate dehydratase